MAPTIPKSEGLRTMIHNSHVCFCMHFCYKAVIASGITCKAASPASASHEAIILPVGDHLAQFTAASCFMVQSHLGRFDVFWEGFGRGTAQSFTQQSWPAVTSFQTATSCSMLGNANAKSTLNQLGGSNEFGTWTSKINV